MSHLEGETITSGLLNRNLFIWAKINHHHWGSLSLIIKPDGFTSWTSCRVWIFLIFKLLIALKKYNLPLLITENGICTEDDGLRWDYIREHLEATYQAIAEGADVIGYIYWSLLDNFEWDKGFGPRFGLVYVDYQNQNRAIKPSARNLAQVIKNGEI